MWKLWLLLAGCLAFWVVIGLAVWELLWQLGVRP